MAASAEKVATSAEKMEESTSAQGSQGSKPTCIIVLGMAGSGKTTFVQVCLVQKVYLLYFNRMCFHCER